MASSTVITTRGIETQEIVDLISRLRVLLQRLGHLLEIGLFARLAFHVDSVVNGLVQISQEHIKAFDVRLNNVKLFQALILWVLLRSCLVAVSAFLSVGRAERLVLHELNIKAILLIAHSNLLEKVLDGHEDDSVLVRLLQPHLSLFLVANHQRCLVCLNFL